MKIPVDEIKFVKELYPRFELDTNTVNQYRTSIEKLPPIIISKDRTLIDGYHRLTASRLEDVGEIEAEILDVEGDALLMEAIRCNSTHGRQLELDEKRENARRLYELFRKNGEEDGVGKIISLLSVSKSSLYQWLDKELREEREERDNQIMDLYLNCHTQEEIGERLELGLGTVSRKLKSIFQNSRDGKMENGVKLTPENLQPYNVWTFSSLGDRQLHFPGQTPKDLIENVIYYYSNPPKVDGNLYLSKVVDPMAGSGITRDACMRLYRRYLLFDVKPIRQDIPIEKNDILKGLPPKARDADLVFLDPPYYDAKSEYVKNEFNRSYSSFLESMKITFKNILSILKPTGKIAFLMMPIREKTFSSEWLDLTIDSVDIAKGLGLKILNRIAAPLSGPNQFQPYDQTRSKELKMTLCCHRDLVIFGVN